MIANREKLSAEQTQPDRATLTDQLTGCADELEAAEDTVDRIRVERLNLIEEALAGGLGPTAIARALGISTQRLDQLRKGAG